MTTDLALEYIKRRGCELCYGDQYTLRVRHFVLQPNEQRKVDGHNQFFVLIEPYCDLRVESSAAIFDLADSNINELEYEHRGDLLLINQSIFTNHVRFIQVIPKECNPCP
ncbi:MAG: hypothetical protein E6Q24_05515 [Chitinophagaceae bacterium]|nr:MAG: hypothetical protein E6Q24_05515 [Chitinophagaceae bacterium]